MVKGSPKAPATLLRTLRAFILSPFLFLIAYLFGPAAMRFAIWLSLADLPSWMRGAVSFYKEWVFLILILGFAAFWFLLIASFLVVSDRSGQPYRASVWAAFLGIVLSTVTLFATDTWPVERRQLSRITANGVPIGKAVEAYRRDHRSPPKALSDLVPAYLPAIPKTGSVLYPDFEYGLDGKEYWLSVPVPDLLEFDQPALLYRPDRSKDTEDTDRIGDWVMESSD